jgi:hypothetical protein
VLHVMHLRMIFKRFQMGCNLRGHVQIHCEALLKCCRQPVCLTDGHEMRKQEVNLDDLPDSLSCGSEPRDTALPSPGK